MNFRDYKAKVILQCPPRQRDEAFLRIPLFIFISIHKASAWKSNFLKRCRRVRNEIKKEIFPIATVTGIMLFLFNVSNCLIYHHTFNVKRQKEGNFEVQNPLRNCFEPFWLGQKISFQRNIKANLSNSLSKYSIINDSDVKSSNWKYINIYG